MTSAINQLYRHGLFMFPNIFDRQHIPRLTQYSLGNIETFATSVRLIIVNYIEIDQLDPVVIELNKNTASAATW